LSDFFIINRRRIGGLVALSLLLASTLGIAVVSHSMVALLDQPAAHVGSFIDLAAISGGFAVGSAVGL
jgi:hypothetical protein